MEWKKPSPELIELLGRRMQAFATTKKAMFGSPVYFVNDQMVTGVHQDNVFLRLSDADRDAFKGQFKNAAAFEPIKGRVMKEYVVVQPQVYGDEPAFKHWVERSMEYARSLPPKAKNPKKK